MGSQWREAFNIKATEQLMGLKGREGGLAPALKRPQIATRKSILLLSDFSLVTKELLNRRVADGVVQELVVRVVQLRVADDSEDKPHNKNPYTSVDPHIDCNPTFGQPHAMHQLAAKASVLFL